MFCISGSQTVVHGRLREGTQKIERKIIEYIFNKCIFFSSGIIIDEDVLMFEINSNKLIEINCFYKI